MSARVMVPLEITSAMILGGTTIAEPAPSETAWVSGANYTVGQERIVVAEHRVFECVQTATGRTVSPELDPEYWLNKRPTLRWAPFDDFSNTKATDVTTMTYVLQTGFINGWALYGLEGISYTATQKDAPGGTTLKTWTGDLYAQAAGFYELLFQPLLQLEQLSFDDAELAPLSELSITINGGTGNPVAIGTIKVGDWRQLIGDSTFGGTQYGTESERRSYTFRRYNDDGTYTTVKRPSSRDIRAQVTLDAEQAIYADAILAEILDVAVPFEASNLGKYSYLNTFGFVTGSIKPDNNAMASLNLTIRGNI